MPQRLSGFPTALLSLLGSQSFGNAPKELDDVISPVIDTAELYLVSAQQGMAGVVAAPAGGYNRGLIVPQGEVWRVNYGGAFVLSGVGVTLDWTPCVRIDGGIVPMGDTIVQLASQTRLEAFELLPIWIEAGQELGVYVSALVGVPTISVAFSVAVLRA